MFNIMYKINMKRFTTSEARKMLSHIINLVVYKNEVIGIGRHNKTEAVIIKMPQNVNSDLNEITNINANSESFDFLEAEEDLYSIDDLKDRYV